MTYIAEEEHRWRAWPGAGPVRQALQTWRSIMGDANQNVRGGANGALLTNFADASKQLFTKPPGCYLDHTAYIDNSGGTLKAGADFDFFSFPMTNDSSTVEVSGDFLAMFRRTPQAEQLVHFLASDVGQRLWPAVPGLDASDLMPSAMSDAFNQAVLSYLSDPDPRNLDDSLSELDAARADTYNGRTLSCQCGGS